MSEQFEEAWRVYFTKSGYQPLIQKDINGEKKLIIDEFCNDDGTVPEELKEIYLLCNKSGIPCELLLVIDVRDKQQKNLNALCRAWDERILSFLNFGILPGQERQSLYLLKYNVMQILLSTSVTAHSNAAASGEKSTDISRKLFVTIENGDVIESERPMLPFYFDQLTKPTRTADSESELEQMLPTRDNLACLYETYSPERSFSEKDLISVKEWLSNGKD